jgi:RNA-directed DNA polymerase
MRRPNSFTSISMSRDRLRALLLHRAGSRLHAGRATVWRRPFFEALGLCRLRGTIQYPGAA